MKKAFLVVVLSASLAAPVRAAGPADSCPGSVLIAAAGYACGLLTWAGGIGAVMTRGALDLQCVDENVSPFWIGFTTGMVTPPLLFAAYCKSRRGHPRRS